MSAEPTFRELVEQSEHRYLGYYTLEGFVPSHDALMNGWIEISDEHQAADLLRTYTAEEIRQLWESGTFGESPQAVKDYLKDRVLRGDLEKGTSVA